MIEILLLTGGIVLIVIIFSYSLTVLPMFWDVLLRYVDKRIREEVRILFDEELLIMREEIASLDREAMKRKETIKMLQDSIGRKLEKDRLSPLEKERKTRPITRR